MGSTALEITEALVQELGLRRISTDELTIARVPHGDGVRFIDSRRGSPVNGAHKARIAALVIPHAWTEARIAHDKQAHMQAVGRDEAGRLQYIYHSAWEDVRAASKAYRLVELGRALPRLRSQIIQDLTPASPSAPLAAAARLVDRAYLRAGHEAYAGEESGRGVATLLKRHVRIDGNKISLRFRGKGGKHIEKEVEDEVLAGVLVRLLEKRGVRLFKLGSGKDIRPMTATDLISYLVDRSRRSISAKDFRTLFASALALDRLYRCEGPLTATARKRAIMAAAREISAGLANTPAIVRKSYIHPTIIESFEAGKLEKVAVERARRGLTRKETALMIFLEKTIPRG